jgi:hypothetical protein
VKIIACIEDHSTVRKILEHVACAASPPGQLPPGAGSKEFEGHAYIAYGWDQLCVALAAFVFCYWGVKRCWRTPAVEAAHGNVPRGP